MESNEIKEISTNTQINSGVTLKVLFSVIFKWKIIVFLFSVFFLILGLIGGFIISNYQAQGVTIVEFQWDGISKGEYPNGDRFDYGSAFNSTIYGKVIEESNLDISIYDLQKIINITPIVPSNILEVSETALLQNVDFSYYPTSFKISIYNGMANISNDQASKLLSDLIEEFRTEFERKYINKSIIIDFSQEDISRFDYIEAIDILYSQIEILKSTINYVMPEADEYVSQELGVGFNEIMIRADLVRDIELSNLDSRINNYLLSKDSDLLITIYQFKAERLSLDLAKEQSIANDLQLLIDNYQGGTSTIIIPGMDTENQVATEPYLNTLYSKLVDSQARIASYVEDIAYYELRIDRLNGEDPNFLATPEKIAEETLKVEAGLLESGETISQIVSDAEIILTEYNRYVSRGLIQTIIPPQSAQENSIIIFAVAGLISGIIVGVGFAFIFDFRANKKKAENLNS